MNQFVFSKAKSIAWCLFNIIHKRMIIFTQMPHKNSECVNKTHINYRNKKKGKQKSMISVLSTDLQTHKPYELIHFIE